MDSVTINEKLQIPRVGLGTFDLKEKEILSGLESGYRLLDTAWQYGNEAEIGRAIKKSHLQREDIIITTKLWTDAIRQNRVREEFEESLRCLQTDYVDIYLIHWPAVGFERAWETMVKLKEEGKIKALGVSNFNEHHLIKLRQISDNIPVLNQLEFHPFFQNKKVVQYCSDQGIALQAWCPLGGSYSRFVEHNVFKELESKYGKTSAQIILRWHIQKNMLIIPRTSRKERLEENLDIFDFVLDETDMELINNLDTGHRIGADPDDFDF